jgi:hypothetical protein
MMVSRPKDVVLLLDASHCGMMTFVMRPGHHHVVQLLSITE